MPDTAYPLSAKALQKVVVILNRNVPSFIALNQPHSTAFDLSLTASTAAPATASSLDALLCAWGQVYHFPSAHRFQGCWALLLGAQRTVHESLTAPS